MSRLHRTSFALFAILLLAPWGPVHAASSGGKMPAPLTSDQQRRIDEIFAPYTNDGPGCVLGITRNLKTVYEKGYGLSTLDYDIPMSPQTSFDIASVSKQFTAMAMITLAHESDLSLDDDVRTYVPEVPDYGVRVTIADLIHHTSGLRDIYMLRSMMGYTEKDYFSEDEFLDIVARQEHPTFTPGTTFRYSNTGYLVMAVIIKRVTGKTLAEYAQDKIFTPLNMTHTFFHDDATRVVKNRATGYHQNKDGSYRRGVTLFELVGDGGITTTVGDLMLWDRDFYQGKVWRDDIKADMLAPGLFHNGEPVVYDGEENGVYAGGVVVGSRRGLDFVRHSGSFVGFKTDQIRFPAQKLGVTVLCNLGSIDANGLSNKVADVLLEDVYPQPEASASEAAEEPAFVRQPIAADILEHMPGSYWSEDLQTAYHVVRQGDTLAFLMGNRRVAIDFEEYAASPIGQLDTDVIGDEVFVFTLVREKGAIAGFKMALAGALPFTFQRQK